jgi:hypothetical protein
MITDGRVNVASAPVITQVRNLASTSDAWLCNEKIAKYIKKKYGFSLQNYRWCVVVVFLFLGKIPITKTGLYAYIQIAPCLLLESK